MMKFLRKAAIAACIGTAALAGTPASAATQTTGIVDPCSANWVTGAIACVGYYGANLLQGKDGQAVSNPDAAAAINTLLNGTIINAPADGANGNYLPGYVAGSYNLDVSKIIANTTSAPGSTTLYFPTLLSGWTVVGVHFGQTSDANNENNVTAFWLLNVTSPNVNYITLQNGTGSSGAQIFATTPAVPEPATWALMLLGFGAVGYGMRRQRREGKALLQLA